MAILLILVHILFPALLHTPVMNDIRSINSNIISGYCRAFLIRTIGKLENNETSIIIKMNNDFFEQLVGIYKIHVLANLL